MRKEEGYVLRLRAGRRGIVYVLEDNGNRDAAVVDRDRLGHLAAIQGKLKGARDRAVRRALLVVRQISPIPARSELLHLIVLRFAQLSSVGIQDPLAAQVVKIDLIVFLLDRKRT